MEEARTALLALERKGVEAAEIELLGDGADRAHLPITNDEQQAADVAMEHADGDYEAVVETLRGTGPSSLKMA